MRLAAGRVAIIVGAVLFLASIAYAVGRGFRSPNPSDPRGSGARTSTLPATPLPDPEPFLALDAFMDARIDSVLAGTPDWRAVVDAESRQERQAAVERIGAAVLDVFPPAPSSGASREEIRSHWFDRDGVRVDEVHISTPTAAILPVAVLTPTRPLTTPAPAVLALHGERASWDSLFEDFDYHHGFALDLARRGFVVVAPLRALGVGRQRYHIDAKGKLSGLSAHTVALWEATGALDLLVREPGVDAEKIGIYGISNGGELALRLGALDPRPAVIIVSNYIADRRSWSLETRRPMAFGAHGNILNQGAVLLDDANLVALIQPRPLAVVVGARDARHGQTRDVFEDFAELYRSAGREADVRLIVTDGGHEIVADSVLPFLLHHLVPTVD